MTALLEDLFASDCPPVCIRYLQQRKELERIKFQEKGEYQTQKVALLMSDIRGYMAATEGLTASQSVNLLNHYFVKMNEVIARYNGVIDKYIGDAILVLFGLPEAHEKDLNNALACAVDMQRAMEEVNAINEGLGLPSLYMGIGVTYGEVTRAILGSDTHFEHSVIGQAVNVVSRIEAQTLRGQILLDEDAYRQVEGTIEVGPPNPIQLKGMQQNLNLYEVLATEWPTHAKVPRPEVRRSPRVAVDVEFNFQLLKGKEVLPNIYHGQIKDLGYNGMYAVLPKLAMPIDEIRLTLSLSFLSTEMRYIYGRVQQQQDVEGGLGCGIEFTALDAESQYVIKAYVDSLL